jgi:hypothetical protein
MPGLLTRSVRGNNTQVSAGLSIPRLDIDLTQRSAVPQEGEEFLGILLFGVGLAILTLFLAPSSGGVGFLVALVAGLLMAGGLDLIVHRTRP